MAENTAARVEMPALLGLSACFQEGQFQDFWGHEAGLQGPRNTLVSCFVGRKLWSQLWHVVLGTSGHSPECSWHQQHVDRA